MLVQHLGSEGLQHLFPGDIPNKMLSLMLVNNIYYGSLRTELIGNASANPVGTTGYYDYFIFECICLHKVLFFYIINMMHPSAFVKI